jgi:hypothetical protein
MNKNFVDRDETTTTNQASYLFLRPFNEMVMERCQPPEVLKSFFQCNGSRSGVASTPHFFEKKQNKTTRVRFEKA